MNMTESTILFVKSLLNDRGFEFNLQKNNESSGFIVGMNYTTKEKVQYGTFELKDGVWNYEVDLEKLKSDIKKLDFYSTGEIIIDSNLSKPYVKVNVENPKSYPKVLEYLAGEIDTLKLAVVDFLGVGKASEAAAHLRRKMGKKNDK